MTLRNSMLAFSQEARKSSFAIDSEGNFLESPYLSFQNIFQLIETERHKEPRSIKATKKKISRVLSCKSPSYSFIVNQDQNSIDFLYLIPDPKEDKRFLVHGAQISLYKNDKDLRGQTVPRDLTEIAHKVAQIGIWEYSIIKNRFFWDEVTKEIYQDQAIDFSTSETYWRSFLHKDDADRVISYFNNCLKLKADFEAEFRVNSPSENPRYLYTKSKFISDNQSSAKYVGTIVDVTEFKMTEEKIKELAFFDPLTQVANRHLALDRLHQTIENSARSNSYHGLLFIDLDDFKFINDNYGHDMGDEVLKKVAARITSATRSQDTVARIGGDEFILITGTLDKDIDNTIVHLTKIVTNIQNAIHQTVKFKEHRHTPSTSIGTTTFKGSDKSRENLLKQADIAMFRAKELKKGSYYFYNEAIQDQLSHRLKIEDEIITGIEKNEFQLYFQPQFDDRRSLVGTEVLLRWKHPKKGLLMPSSFINIAEKSQIISRLGLWVIENACITLNKWKDVSTLSECQLSINISAKQFLDKNFHHLVETILKKHSPPKHKLVFEITESLLMEDCDNAISQMRNLNALGIRFSIDDFGTGYSSLSYLKNLPVHELKIDKSFIDNINEDIANELITRSIIGLAKNFDLTLIAEGVENIDQLKKLSDMGCYVFQGYYFSEPLSYTDYNDYIKATAYPESLEKNENPALSSFPYLGVAPRRYAFSQLDYWIRNNADARFTFLVCEIHDFKSINDSYGIAFGDRIIDLVSKRITKVAPSGSLIARMGGDGFGILVPENHSNNNSAMIIANKALQFIQRPISIDANIIVLNASIGIASYPDHGKTAHEVIQGAESALHGIEPDSAIKIQSFKAFRLAQKQQQHSMQNDLRHSIVIDSPSLVSGENCNHFSMVYLPKFCTKTQKVLEVEAMVEWRHPKRGRMSPPQYIKPLEKISLAHQIGFWNVQHSINKARKLIDSGVTMSIKVCSTQLLRDDLLISFLQKSDLDRSLKERIRFDFPVHFIGPPNVSILFQIKRLGFGLGVDEILFDLNTLSNLSKLPIDQVRMENGFLKKLFSEQSKAYQKSLQLIKEFNLLLEEQSIIPCISGVENQAQLEILHDSGFQQAQGYCYPKPLTIGEIESTLLTDNFKEA